MSLSAQGSTYNILCVLSCALGVWGCEPGGGTESDGRERGKYPEKSEFLLDLGLGDQALGAVVDAAGDFDATPVPGWSIVLVSPLGDKSPMAGVSVKLSAAGAMALESGVTDKAGRFPIPRLHALASHPILGDLPISYYTVFALSQDHSWGAWQDIAVQGGVPQAVVMPLRSVSPLGLDVMDEGGGPIQGVSARVSRGIVDTMSLPLHHLDEGGELETPGLPEGRYMVHVEAPGYLARQVEVDHVLEASAHQVRLEVGRDVVGQVVDERGQGVSGAWVTVYMDRYGDPQRLSFDSFMRLDALPVRGVVMADLEGYFAIGGLEAGVAYLTAQASEGVPAVSEPVDVRARAQGNITLVLWDGLDVEVIIKDEDGGLVQGARVSWKDELAGLSSEFVTGSDGAAVFEAVSADAAFSVHWGKRHISQLALPGADEDGVHRLEVTLEPESVRPTDSALLRLTRTPGARAVGVQHVQFVRDGQTCLARAVSGQDWAITGCTIGRQGWLEVHTTAHGIARQVLLLEEEMEVSLEAPVGVSVEVERRGLEMARMWWRQSSGGGRQEGGLEAKNIGKSSFIWRGELYPGSYRFELQEGEGSVHRKMVEVPPEGGQAVWSFERERRFGAFVVDPQGKGVRGAWVEVWSAGRRQEVLRSQGVSATEVVRHEAGSFWLVVLGPQGRGQREVSAKALEEMAQGPRGELVVGLEAGGGALSARAGDVWDRRKLEGLLGAAIVVDHDRWLLDVKDPESPAAKAGLPRGAVIVGAREVTGSLEVLVATEGVVSAVSVSPAR